MEQRELFKRLLETYQQYKGERRKQSIQVKTIVNILDEILKYEESIKQTIGVLDDLEGNSLFKRFNPVGAGVSIGCLRIKIENLKDERNKLTSEMTPYNSIEDFLRYQERKITGKSEETYTSSILEGKFKHVSPACRKGNLHYLNKKYFSKTKE